MNLYSSNVTLKLTGVLDTSQMKVYLMSAPNQNLQSKSVCLNGDVLKMTADDRLPDITPVSMNDSVEMPPYSYVFIILTRANVNQCTR